MPYISYSEFKNWSECTWKHKLLYIDKIKLDSGNEYTAFGTAMHDTIEQMLFSNISDYVEQFNIKFTEVLATVKIVEDTKLATEMRQQAPSILAEVIPSMNKYFEDKGGWVAVKAEEELFEAINEIQIKDYSFKGFIDLVIKDGQGNIHIIDWKTCSWGWDAEKKANNLFGRQLVFYKHYYAQKHSINPRTILTHFGLLKRTAKKDKVELFKVTSGEIKTRNSLDALDKALYNITNNKSFKNRLACTYCPFKGTEYCT